MRLNTKEWAIGEHCHVCGQTDTQTDDCISDYADEGYIWCHTCGADTLLVGPNFPFWDKTGEDDTQ